MLLAALVVAPAASAYGWPLQPFAVEHPVRGNFGDPRTLFYTGALDSAGLNGDGSFSFHNGIDISAEPWQRVYPVVSGTVTYALSGRVAVRQGNRVFHYMHLEPGVAAGDTVTARRTVLGYVQPSAAHVHLAELFGGRAVNPLAPGRLAPYTDRAAPRIGEIGLAGIDGAAIPLARVGGSVRLTAVATDATNLLVPGSWAGLPVSPAYVGWSLSTAGGRPIVRERAVADFRGRLPYNRDFWAIYARGTYQNKPRFGNRQYLSEPGRFQFLLSSAFDTRLLDDGGYVLAVTASDIRDNRGTGTVAFSVCNAGPPACGAAAPAP